MEGRGNLTFCFCMPGFTGQSCQTDIDYCTSSTCSNGGTCVEGPGRVTTCACLDDYIGPTCLSLIEQDPIPCPAETDSDWMLMYPATMPGEVVNHACSEISSTTIAGQSEYSCPH